MSWRPDGWKNPHSMSEREERLHLYDVGPRNAFEAGADAMLEALKAKDDTSLIPGILQGTDNSRVEAILPNVRGFCVIIPDEEL